MRCLRTHSYTAIQSYIRAQQREKRKQPKIQEENRYHDSGLFRLQLVDGQTSHSGLETLMTVSMFVCDVLMYYAEVLVHDFLCTQLKNQDRQWVSGFKPFLILLCIA